MPYPRDKPHARIYRHWLDLPSWTTLTAVAQSLIVNLMASYRPQEPNRFEISDRAATALVRCSRNTAAKAMAELEDRGWLRVIRVGRMRGPKAKRASVYVLTAFPEDISNPATKDFLRWQPQPIQRLKERPSTAQIRAVNGSHQAVSEERPRRSTATARH
jgi:DNA-binding transcriptional MocR family regulator